MRFAEIIVDLSAGAVDRLFTYAVIGPDGEFKLLNAED